MSFPAYPEYKDSGVEWLGKIPCHWVIKPIKAVGCSPDDLFLDGDWIESKNISDHGIRYLTTGNVGAGFYKEQGSGYISDETFSQLECTEVFSGDILISRLNHPIGRACVVPNLGSKIVTAVDNVIFRCRYGLNKKFFVFRLSSPDYFHETGNIASGATMQRISRKELGAIRVALPPLEEQTAIAAFLDRETGKIDALIAEQEKLLTLLAEKRQATISHAVTRGLNPNAPMKDSGIAWLGEVPENWKMLRVKDCSSAIVDCKNRTPDAVLDGKYFVVRTSCVKNGIFDSQHGYFTDQENFIEWTEKGLPTSGDVLFTREAPVGEACLAPQNLNFCLGQRMMYIRPDNSSIKSEFLLYSIYGGVSKERIQQKSKGSTVGHLRVGEVGELPILLPPLEEQALICNFLLLKLSKIDSLSNTTRLASQILKERRSALIAAAVTGKIDVRNATSHGEAA